MKRVELNKIGNFDTWESAKLQERKTANYSEDLGQKLLFENDNMRIWEALLLPNERLPFRRIKNDYWWISMNDALAITRNLNGKISLLKFKKGDSTFLDFQNTEQISDLENIGENPLHLHMMEFKPKLESADQGLNSFK